MYSSGLPCAEQKLDCRGKYVYGNSRCDSLWFIDERYVS
jgi:hypothetical protein